MTVSSGVPTDLPQQCGERLSSDCSMEYLSSIFTQACEELGMKIPKDFLVLANSAMVGLSEKYRSNILYNLTKGIHANSSDSCFPMQRMPMGLMEYTASFLLQMI